MEAILIAVTLVVGGGLHWWFRDSGQRLEISGLNSKVENLEKERDRLLVEAKAHGGARPAVVRITSVTETDDERFTASLRIQTPEVKMELHGVHLFRRPRPGETIRVWVDWDGEKEAPRFIEDDVNVN